MRQANLNKETQVPPPVAPTPAAERPTPYKPKYAPLWNNLVTMVGMFLAAAAIILLAMFALYSIVTPTANPYVDVAGYLVVPGILVLGLIIIPLGILFKSWRLHRRDPEQRLSFRFPRVDLNDPTQRRAAKLVAASGLVLMPVIAVSGYHGYHYTDSAGFCAKVCHTVMRPQATTYERSAHARVACAECHIGAGASWFVKSKLSGTRQVFATLQDSFPRPLPSAITELRPARETCEQCHWPKKFFGAQLKQIIYFAADETNTRREIDMLLKTGGGDETLGRAEGIHAHMALAGRIEYLATDEKLQDIPWVRFTNKAGDVLIYRSDGRPSSDPMPKGQLRQLDCMDCHNRPAHKFLSPMDAVDLFLDVGKIDTTLPCIKREAVKVLARAYPDTDTAMERIGAALSEFYQTTYPDVWRARLASVNQAIDGVREIYRQSMFPEMKVDWRTYPDNIGHKISPGCFRCHEGRHVNQYGEKISHACDICHSFLNPVEQEGGRRFVERGDFVHAIKLEGVHATLRCDKCHTGGTPLLTTCDGCHTTQTAFRAGTLEDFQRFHISADSMADSVDCQSCHDLTQPTDIETINARCMDCHEDEPERFGTMLASWHAEVQELLARAEAQADAPDRESLRLLRQAGPLHNIEATRTILEGLADSSPVLTGAAGPDEPPEP